MSTEIDQNKLKVAIDWVNKLANGINPLSGEPVPDNEIVNNVHISRCLFYVAGILSEAGNKRVRRELDFHITPEDAQKVVIVEGTGISMFVSEINKIIPKDMKRLSAVAVTGWLVGEGYLREIKKDDGHTTKTPTEAGRAIGISSEIRNGVHGDYLAITYSTEAQRFILESLSKKGNMERN